MENCPHHTCRDVRNPEKQNQEAYRTFPLVLTFECLLTRVCKYENKWLPIEFPNSLLKHKSYVLNHKRITYISFALCMPCNETWIFCHTTISFTCSYSKIKTSHIYLEQFTVKNTGGHVASNFTCRLSKERCYILTMILKSNSYRNCFNHFLVKICCGSQASKQKLYCGADTASRQKHLNIT